MEVILRRAMHSWRGGRRGQVKDGLRAQLPPAEGVSPTRTEANKKKIALRGAAHREAAQRPRRAPRNRGDPHRGGSTSASR